MTTASAKTLITAGPSEWGASRYSTWMECQMKYARTYVEKQTGALSDALIRGILGHAGLAHYYAPMMASHNAQQFYSPDEAVAMVAAEIGNCALPVVPQVLAMLDEYRFVYSVERFEVLAVEHLLETRFGDAPYTARIDLIVRDTAGRVWFYDHKTMARLDSRSIAQYTLSTQFLGQQLLGMRHYGDAFGGIRLNLIGMERPFKFDRRSPDPAPWMLANFPGQIEACYRGMMQAQQRGQSLQQYGVNLNACVGRYGMCAFHEKCRWGE